MFVLSNAGCKNDSKRCSGQPAALAVREIEFDGKNSENSKTQNSSN